jgi:hypothetical protein
VKVLEVNHFESAPPMHHGGASCGKKYPPTPADNSQIARLAA